MYRFLIFATLLTFTICWHSTNKAVTDRLDGGENHRKLLWNGQNCVDITKQKCKAIGLPVGIGIPNRQAVRGRGPTKTTQRVHCIIIRGGVPFDLGRFDLLITNGIVSSKIYDKRDDFNFEIVNFPFLDGDVPRSPSYGVYISQLIRFARVCSNVDDFNNRNLFLTAKLLKQGYRYHKIRKAFSKFYYKHSELIVKYNIGLKTLLQQGISEPIFYGDLVYKFKQIVGKPNFSDQFKKIVKRYIRVGYNLNIMRQSACLVLNPIAVYSYGFLFNCTTVGQASDSMTALT